MYGPDGTVHPVSLPQVLTVCTYAPLGDINSYLRCEVRDWWKGTTYVLHVPYHRRYYPIYEVIQAALRKGVVDGSYIGCTAEALHAERRYARTGELRLSSV